MTPFVWRDGVHIVGTALWCDARRARSLCFLSHGGRLPGTQRPGGRGRHRQLLCTEGTERLLAAAGPGDGGGAPAVGDVLRCPYGRPFSLGPLRLELFPSGYLPGAASLLVTLETGGGRRPLVYAGDLNPRPGPLCEPMQIRAAEALVCHAPLAALGRALPERAEAEAALLSRLTAILDGGGCAVVLAPELGLAQDLLALLGREGLPLVVHPRILRLLSALAPPGTLQPQAVAFGPRHPARAGAVLLWPLERPLGPLLAPRPGGARAPLHLLLCAGGALSEELVLRYRRSLPGEAAGLPLLALPFPDGIDLPGLLRYVEIAEARDVYLTAGAGEAVERALSARGVRLWPLGPPRQLELFAAPPAL